LPDHPELTALIPSMEFIHKPGVGGVKCGVCGTRPEYREANEHIRLKQKIGPEKATWLCPDCHLKYKLGKPDQEPEPPQEVVPEPLPEPAGGIPEQSRNEIKRDQNLEDQTQKSPETIPDSPISENNGPEPAEDGTETGTPKPWDAEVEADRGYEIPDVIGGVSLGIERMDAGFKIQFSRNGNTVLGTFCKTPPWLSPKVVSIIGVALGKKYPDLLKTYNKDHIREILTDAFQAVAEAIEEDPQAAALLMPPSVTYVLNRVERVAITLFKDGLGGGEPIYELFTGKDEQEDPRTITLTLGDMVSETPGMFKKRWTAAFVADFLELNRADWELLRSSLVGRAEIREAEHTGEGDALISELLEELGFMSFTRMKDVWKAKTDAFLLCEQTPEGWLIFVNSKIIFSFLKKRDYDPNSWTPKLSKELKNRGIVAQDAKKVRVEKGPTGTIRVWTFTGDSLGFHEDHLWERATPPGKESVPGSENVPGTTAPTPELTENRELPRPEHGGV